MPVLYTTIRDSGKQFNFLRISVYGGDGGAAYRPHVYFWTTERSNIMKVIKKFILSRSQEQKIDDKKSKYTISEQDREMIKLLHKNQKKYAAMRRLLKATTRDEVVLELEIENISDAILS